MKEVKKCSISGVAFTMDVDAFERLNVYLSSLKATYKGVDDGPEIVADIEARIAELILTTQNAGRVVELPLVENIIVQMGSAEDIAEPRGDGSANVSPRIPRRLYRDTENAKLGGVCAGVGRFFDIDPTWIRLMIFLPMFLSITAAIPFMDWAGPMFGNLFGICVICYFIMWFAVPAPRSARQILEMNGERITEESIRQTTALGSNNDADRRARPIVAEIVSLFGRIILMLMKIVAGFIIFGLIIAACALIIALFALSIGGPHHFNMWVFDSLPLAVPIISIFIVLIPVVMLVYTLMCLIASRKPGGKTLLAFFLLWLISIIACSVIVLRSDVVRNIKGHEDAVMQLMNSTVHVDDQTKTIKELLQDENLDRLIQKENGTVTISVPDKNIDIKFNKTTDTLSKQHLEATVKMDITTED